VFAKLVKPGGQFGIVAPGTIHEYEMGYPPALKEYWLEFGFFTFHSNDWWRKMWEKTGVVDVTASYDIENPKKNMVSVG
jgi:hypothetical protein